MLKKEHMLPGVRLRIKEQPSTGIPKAIFGDTNVPQRTITYVTITQEPGSYLDGHAAIQPGEICEVVAPPKKYTPGINAIKVKRADGVEGFAYWSEMRASAEIVENKE